jgi:hypothetical protein
MPTEEPCPHCGSTSRRIMYNKWHVREVYCGECFKSLNQDEVREQTRLAQQAAQEGKLHEFWMGVYPTPKEKQDESLPEDDSKSSKDT